MLCLLTKSTLVNSSSSYSIGLVKQSINFGVSGFLSNSQRIGRQRQPRMTLSSSIEDLFSLHSVLKYRYLLIGTIEYILQSYTCIQYRGTVLVPT